MSWVYYNSRVTVCCCYIYIFFFSRTRIFSFFFFFFQKKSSSHLSSHRSLRKMSAKKRVGDAKIRDIFIRGIFFFFFFFGRWTWSNNGYFVIFRSWCMETKKKSGGRCGRQGRWRGGKAEKGELQQNDNVNIISHGMMKEICTCRCVNY